MYVVHIVPSNVYKNKVVVGPSNWMIWGLDLKHNVYVRTNVTDMLPIGDQWELIPSVQCHQLSISENKVSTYTWGFWGFQNLPHGKS